ncbi:MAG: DUF305 domain-containing protein [Patulibacter sp.]
MTLTLGRIAATALLLPLALGVATAGCGSDHQHHATSTGSATATSPRAVDQAFVRQMIPHHQQAVEMAEIAGAHAEHDEIKRLARAIISTQRKEIAKLSAIGQAIGAGESSDMAGDAATLGLAMNQMGMSMDMSTLADADRFDQAFIDDMTVHHAGAVAMAKAQLRGGADARLSAIATAIVDAQQAEIEEMANWRADWYGTAADDAAGTAGTMHEMTH